MIVYIITVIYWILLTFTSIYHKDKLMVLDRESYGDQFITNRNKLVLLAFFPIFMLMALKSTTVGADTFHYLIRYEQAENMLDLVSYKTEFGFNYIGYFFHSILHFPWQLYLAVLSAFICFAFGLFIKEYSEDVVFSTFIHMTIGLFTMSMSGIRQTLAISLCLISLIIVHSKPKSIITFIRAILLAFIAISIHNSAVCFFPILFFARLRLNKINALIINLVAVISGMFLRDPLIYIIGYVIPSRYSSFNLDSNYAINWLVIAVTIIIPIFCLLCSHEGDNIKFNYKISTMYILTSLNILFTFLAINNGQLGRLAYYFQPAYLAIIPSTQWRFSKNSRRLALYIIGTVCMTYFLMGAIGGTLQIDNYQFFWDTDM